MEVYILFTDDYEIHSETLDNCEGVINSLDGFVGFEYYDEDGIERVKLYPARYIYRIDIDRI